MRRSYEEVDWAATPLGPMGSWSPTLRNAVDLALHTQFPVTVSYTHLTLPTIYSV